MLVDRLTDIEIQQQSILKHMKFDERKKAECFIDSHLFGWNFPIHAHADDDRHFYSSPDHDGVVLTLDDSVFLPTDYCDRLMDRSLDDLITTLGHDPELCRRSADGMQWDEWSADSEKALIHHKVISHLIADKSKELGINSVFLDDNSVILRTNSNTPYLPPAHPIDWWIDVFVQILQSLAHSPSPTHTLHFTPFWSSAIPLALWCFRAKYQNAFYPDAARKARQLLLRRPYSGTRTYLRNHRDFFFDINDCR